MRIKDITITNFKSIYGKQYFNFDDLEGLVKLSGIIGSGKTTLGEAIIYGLFGTVKEQKNPALISWNTKSCEVEMNIVSKKKEINIVRNIKEPLKVKIDGKLLVASNKRNTQEILENEYFDVPKFAIEKMCVISFNIFKSSLANMNPGETKQFLDNIFGFKTFTQYNDQVNIEKKEQIQENTKLNAIYKETEEQIEHLKSKKHKQQEELKNSVDITGLDKKREEYVCQGKAIKQQYSDIENEYDNRIDDLNKEKRIHYNKKIECAALGKQQKDNYNKFKDGICPTCNQSIDESIVNEYKNKMLEYAKQYKNEEEKENAIIEQIDSLKKDKKKKLDKLSLDMNSLRYAISDIDTKMKIYEHKLKLMNDNYDDLISEYEQKLIKLKEEINHSDIEICQWNELNELFSKTFRYNLLETLIPHINNSIQVFINKLDQQFKVTYDQEFKAHIFVDTFDHEISYNNLSTGQKKSLDLAIIFGILENVIANVEFNVLFLDELFSNLDSESRNLMLSLLRENLGKDKTIFVINHAEMGDDYFDHKIRVTLNNKKIESEIKKNTTVVVKASKYENIF